MKYLYFRHIFLSTLWRLSACLIFLYLLYALIDYSIHMQEFANMDDLSFANLFLYYFLIFSKRLDFLLPLSLLIASIRTLSLLNESNELLALQSSGISIKKICAPLFLLANICMVINLVNFQFFVPNARNYIDLFETQLIKKPHSFLGKSSKLIVRTCSDNSKVIFSSQQSGDGSYIDAYWIESIHSIWHAKELSFASDTPTGKFVDHFVRDENGHLIKNESFDLHHFINMHYQSSASVPIKLSSENKSITTLLYSLYKKNYSMKEERLEIETYLYYKLIMPFVSFLVLIMSIPFCIKFSRGRRFYYVFAFSIFGYICFFTLMDACAILSINNIITPILALNLIPLLLFLFYGIRLRFAYD
ncbi:MAG: LptF/LptG family permease [Chlamydiales bacterium]|nr:LptF/LptG family permease [Chlamydiales bacterium]